MYVAGPRDVAMDTITFAKYPFTQEALRLRQGPGLFDRGRDPVKPAYAQVRTRARQRVLSAIKGEEGGYRFDDAERELLSYPVARILVAAAGDQYLIKRFALYASLNGLMI